VAEQEVLTFSVDW